MNIQGISSVNKLIEAVPLKNTGESKETLNFKELLMDALKNVNSLEQESSKMTEDFIAGRTDDIHSVMIAGEKASISLEYIIEIRNKVLDAYQEIMRMSI